MNHTKESPQSLTTNDTVSWYNLPSYYWQQFTNYNRKIENIHFGYMNYTMLLSSLNLISFLLLGFRIQSPLFVLIFMTQCSKSWVNIFHAIVVLLHDQIHTYAAYYTLVESRAITADEIWHLIYIPFLLFRFRRALFTYKIIIGVYTLVTVLALFFQQDLIFWVLYFNGFIIAFQFFWIESNTKTTPKYWFYTLLHAFFSLCITFNNPIGRVVLQSIPAGSSFLSEAVCYGIIYDHYNQKDIEEDEKASKQE